MRRMARDYQNGMIYMIWAGDERYYGSTCDTLSKRMGRHRNAYKHNHGKITAHKLFDTYGLENCKIELVEEFPCNSKQELEAREGFYIRGNKCVNKIIPGRTSIEYSAKYYQDNKEYIKEYYKEYYAKYRQDNKERKKEYNAKYRQDNKEYMAEYKAKWYQLKKNSQSAVEDASRIQT
jgi:hypothetical protein